MPQYLIRLTEDGEKYKGLKRILKEHNATYLSDLDTFPPFPNSTIYYLVELNGAAEIQVRGEVINQGLTVTVHRLLPAYEVKP